jgi:HSP20 family protein
MVRLTQWDPMRDMVRMMNEAMRYPGDRESVRGSWVPPVDIKETADALEIVAEMPGFSPDQVEVSAENGVLTFRGERLREEAREGESFHRVERSYGAFERSFQIPRNVDPEKIEASFDKGLLHLTMPKRPESRPRTIKVKVN